MKKIYGLLVIGMMIGLTAQVNAQWVTSGTKVYNLGNVGIGVTNPLTELHIEGNAPVLRFKATNLGSGVRFDVRDQTGDLFRFQKDGATQMVINNLGNVGIGTTSATYKLDVTGTFRATGNARANSFTIAQTGGGGTGVTLKADAGQTNLPFIRWEDNSGTTLGGMRGLSNGGISFGTGYFTEVMYMKTDGLDISGSLKTTGAYTSESANPTFILKETGVADNNYDIQVNNGDFKILKVNDARSTFDEVFSITDNNNVGIGTTTPKESLQIGDNWTFHNGGHKIIGYNHDYVSPNSKRIQDDEASAIRFTSDGDIWFDHAGYDVAGSTINWGRTLVLKNTGNVGIGTTNPDSKLTVKGDIHAEEVKVDLSVPGPDYVFEEDYDLTSLKALEAYIKANKHLPEIPSAEEMEEKGIDLGVMNMLLLKKIEELTLYTIAQEKALKKEKKSNREAITELVKRMEKLENKKGE